MKNNTYLDKISRGPSYNLQESVGFFLFWEREKNVRLRTEQTAEQNNTMKKILITCINMDTSSSPSCVIRYNSIA